MADYRKAFEVVLEHEGQFSNDIRDRGGPTNFGITLQFMLDWHGQDEFDFDLNNDGKVDIEDIRLLKPEDAFKTYHYFWDKNHYGQFNSQSIATKVLDIGVNLWYVRPNKFLQQSCNEISGVNNLKIDGLIGTKTVTFLNGLCENIVTEKKILARLKEKIVAEYHRLNKNGDNDWAIKGLIKRALD